MINLNIKIYNVEYLDIVRQTYCEVGTESYGSHVRSPSRNNKTRENLCLAV